MQIIVNGQVNLQSGGAEFSLPVFSYSDGKSGLATSTTLNYYSGNGIKVGDIASNVGLGWILNASSAIERIQRGEPDDQYTDVADGFNEADLIIKRDLWDVCDKFYPNGFLYNDYLYSTAKSIAVQPRFSKSLGLNLPFDYKQSRIGGADREPDVFSCNLNGRMVNFMIGKDRTVECLDDSKLRVTFTETDMRGNNIQTRIDGFTVMDENGIQYKFNVLELSELVTSRQIYNDNATDFNFSQYTDDKNGRYVVDKWYLSEMRNITTGEQIRYEYITKNIDFITGKNVTYQKMLNDDGESVTVMEGHSFIKAKRISKIIFPDGHNLEFKYDPSFIRYDVTGDNPLSSLILKYNNTNIKSFNFVYNYFYKKAILTASAISDLSYDKQYARLCLSQVYSSADGIIIPPYKFTYYTGSESSNASKMVPSRYSLNVDHWGYYNESVFIDETSPYNKQYLRSLLLSPGTYRSPTPGAAILGVLKSVQYPAGGSITYEYEQNDFLNPSNVNEVTGGIRVHRIIVFDGENASNNQIAEYDYQLANGLSSGWGTEPPVYTMSKHIRVRTDNSGFRFGGLYALDRKSIAAIKTMNFVANKVLSVGLGIASVGLAISMPVSFVAAIIFQIIIPLIHNWLDPWNDFDINYTYFYGLNFSNPAPYQYSRVIVTNSSVANSGKTVQEFTKPENYVGEVAPIDFPYSSEQRFDSWKYGLPKLTQIFNNTSIYPIKEIENNYFSYQAVLSDAFFACKVDVNTYLSSRYDFPVHNDLWVQNNWIVKDYYSTNKGWSMLTSTTETDYDVNGSSPIITSRNTTNYDYNYQNHQPNCIRTKDSKGRIKGQNIYYPIDYNNIDPAITSMKANNIIGFPLTTVLWEQDNTNTPRKMLSAKTTGFKKLPDGRIRPVTNHSTSLAAPIISTLTTNNDPNILTNYLFYEQVSENVYDAFGNLIEVKDQHKRIQSNIYGYNRRRVIAQVSGASVTEVAYTSFEGDDLGGIDYDPLNYDRGNQSRMSYVFNKCEKRLSVTGDYCYPVSKGVSFTMNLLKPYLLTLWATGSASDITVNSSITPARTGPTYNGWTYYEFDIPANTQDPILSGTVNVYIDEVRLYPQGIKMTTSTYNPSYGKTSECDVNNRINYFEYDGMGRLIKLRDEKRNLMKTYEYHYKSNP